MATARSLHDPLALCGIKHQLYNFLYSPSLHRIIRYGVYVLHLPLIQYAFLTLPQIG
jgi:hypothetical protein